LLVVILGFYGVEAEIAVALGVVLFSSVLVISSIGLGYQIALTLELARWNTSQTEKVVKP
jgi:hypothetical protein